MPKLFSEGRVYLVDSPEYFAKGRDGKIYMAKSLEKIKERAPKGADIKHIKGWGEFDPIDLEALAMSPDTRKLIRIMPVQGKDKVKFVKLMGEDREMRKELLGV
jgi:DNA gyrase/topoisomerase IV subunit B